MCICDLQQECVILKNAYKFEIVRLELMALNIFGLPLFHNFIFVLFAHMKIKTIELCWERVQKNSATRMRQGNLLGRKNYFVAQITRFERRPNYPKRFNETTIISAKNPNPLGAKQFVTNDALGFLFHTNTPNYEKFTFFSNEKLKTVTIATTARMSSRDRFARGANVVLTCKTTRYCKNKNITRQC